MLKKYTFLVFKTIKEVFVSLAVEQPSEFLYCLTHTCIHFLFLSNGKGFLCVKTQYRAIRHFDNFL